ncbi:MAG: hypothetical protein EZS28_011621 [Streblomastix strix]|uniref:TraD/TraG TraM recognition site domain-containing protein n=1 Tax=Streblomastix strix TaxID=222440 RepID=A0A5J4WDT2_9EUKA|nr:MAG: hypothetical protein EZS28_011621 [Streblomastix strix]
MKNLIKIPTKIVTYSQTDATLDDLIECKLAYDQVIEQHFTDQLDETSRKEILDAVGATNFKIKSPHIIVLFDDAMSIFKNKMSPLFQKLFKNRQPRITYFLCLQDIIGLDAAIKSNVDSIYFFGAFNRQKFNLFFYQSSIPIDKEELWSQYVQLAKREALLVKYNEDGTTISVIQ